MYRRGRYQQDEESIYDLIPQKEQAIAKPKMYKSKYPNKTPPTASTFGRGTAAAVVTTNMQGDYDMASQAHNFTRKGANFGNQAEHYSDPTSYLKKTRPDLPQPESFQYKVTRKPSLDAHGPSEGRRANKDFIKENAVDVIMAEPRKRPVKDENYLVKKNYGQVPRYLEKVKKDVASEKEYINTIIEQEQMMYQQSSPQMQLLEESERVRLLEQLKSKWEQVNHNYQNMTHIVTLDTIGKVRRKEEYESQLQQLEKSIEKMSKPLVFVQADMGY